MTNRKYYGSINRKRRVMAGKRTGDKLFYQINSTYRIDADRLNFVLKRKGQAEDGSEGKSWKPIGFYQTVNQLYHALVELSIKESSLVDIKVMNEKVNELHQLIENSKINLSKIGVE